MLISSNTRGWIGISTEWCRIHTQNPSDFHWFLPFTNSITPSYWLSMSVSSKLIPTLMILNFTSQHCLLACHHWSSPLVSCHCTNDPIYYYHHSCVKEREKQGVYVIINLANVFFYKTFYKFYRKFYD